MMSEMAKAARAAMKKKAAHMTAGDPHAKVDSSSWTPPEMMNTEAKTGLRPISRRAYKKGGKVVAVEGADAKHHAGKKPRKATGGEAAKYANAKVNRNVKDANAEIDKPHVGGYAGGGYAKGGRKSKMDGGLMMDPRMNMVKPGRLNFGQNVVTPGMNKGGKADIAQDKKLIKKALRQHETAEHGGHHSPLKLKKGGKSCYADGGEIDPRDVIKTPPKPAPMPTQEEIDRYNAMLAAKAEAERIRKEEEEARKKQYTPKKSGGAAGEKWIQKAIKHPGALHKALHVKEGEKIPAKKLAKAAHSDNPKLAKRARLAQTLKRLHKKDGGLSMSEGGGNYTGGTRPTGGRIARKDGGRAKKGKTNINIVIATGRHPDGVMGNQPAGGPTPIPPLPPRAPMMPPPVGMPPGAMPPGVGAAPPMPPIPPGAMMGRKAGGRVGHRGYKSYKDMDAGAGSGLGRLEKTEIAEHRHSRKAGGRTYRSYKDMDAGAGSGLGRKEKTEIQKHK